MSERSHRSCWTGERYEHICQEPSGRPCVERGCDEPAGTGWGPYWYALAAQRRAPARRDHSAVRGRGFQVDVVIVDEATGQLREMAGRLGSARADIAESGSVPAALLFATGQELENRIQDYRNQHLGEPEPGWLRRWLGRGAP